MKEEIKYTDEWLLLEKGKDYLRKKSVFSDIDKCHRFFQGEQWHGLNSGGVEPVVYNIIKPIVKYKVGVINANGYEIIYTPENFDKPEFQKEMEKVCEKLNYYTGRVLEHQKIDHYARKVLKQAAIVGEGILYFDYDEEIKAEVVAKGNIFYGNENNESIQDQPYILLTFRRNEEEVKKEAEENRKNNLNKLSKEDIKNMMGDNDTHEQAGDYAKDEVDDMITCVLKMWKEKGKVWIKKSTKTAVYEDERNTGLTNYPVAHYTWEEEEGSARGVGVVKNHISNQIEINKTLMRRVISVKMGAYPKMVADKEKITNPSALNEVGSAILVDGQTIDDVRKVVGYLNPSTMSIDSEKLQNEMITITRELDGAGEIATGEINPEQASGRAILAVQQASKEPLNEQVNRFKNFMEDIGRILIDMWKTYSESGKNIIIEEEDELQTFKISKTQLENLEVNIKIEVTPRTPYDKFAQELSLENLLAKGFITFEEYVKALPHDSSMPKSKLETILQEREEAQEAIGQVQQQVNMMTNELEGMLQQQASTNEIEGIQEQGNLVNKEIGGQLNELQGM